MGAVLTTGAAAPTVDGAGCFHCGETLPAAPAQAA